MSLTHNSKITTNGMVLYLDAANVLSYPGSGNLWKDLYKTGYNITLYNSPTYNGKYFNFNGVDQYGLHNTPSFNTSTQSYTMEVLFRMRTLPVDVYSGQIYGGQQNNNLVLYVFPQSNSESPLNMIYDDSGNGGLANKKIIVDEWVHWIVCGNPGSVVGSPEVTHYVNGEFDSTKVMYADRTWSTATYMGYDSRWLNYTNMDIALVRRYNRELSFDEVKQNFVSVRGRVDL